MYNKIKIKKIQSLINKEITYILRYDIKNKLLKTIIINEVKISSNLEYAKIYYSLFQNQDNKKIHNIIQKNQKKIKKKLAIKIHIYRCPILKFIFDETWNKINRINEILKQIKNKTNK